MSLSRRLEQRPSAKRLKVDKDDCVICFEVRTKINKERTTEYCKQNCHVSRPVRSGYKLTFESHSRRGRNENAEELGVPICFVCRGGPGNVVPLNKNMLKATLLEVRNEPRLCRNADYANRELTLNRYYLLSLDAGTVTIRYKNGVEKS